MNLLSLRAVLALLVAIVATHSVHAQIGPGPGDDRYYCMKQELIRFCDGSECYCLYKAFLCPPPATGGGQEILFFSRCVAQLHTSCPSDLSSCTRLADVVAVAIPIDPGDPTGGPTNTPSLVKQQVANTGVPTGWRPESFTGIDAIRLHCQSEMETINAILYRKSSDIADGIALEVPSDFGSGADVKEVGICINSGGSKSYSFLLSETDPSGNPRTTVYTLIRLKD